MIKAVIFDCFGVLATDGWLPFKKKYFGDNPELEQQAGDLIKRADAGLADTDEFITEIAALAGIDELEARRQIQDNVPNEPLFEYIHELKTHYKIGLLSNSGRNWLKDIFSDEQLDCFDAFGLSYEMGSSKPEASAYQLIAQRLGVDPSECIFVDDLERYCAAGSDAGMQAVHYRDFDQFKAELEQLLSASQAA
jgi:HAD superfamily hydrolase (TIGR01509 family)